jgi:hypothetical protein
MSIGDGIFLGLLAVGLVWLYTSTKDRWRWRRIALWAGLLGVALPIAGIGCWITYENFVNARPHSEPEFWGLGTGILPADVVFRKGEPSSRQDTYWVYGNQDSDVIYVVRFKNERVRAVEAFSGSRDKAYLLPSIQGISSHSTTEDIFQKFGPPDVTSEKIDHTQRMVSYLRYGIFFTLEKNQVSSLGIIDPAQGAYRFIEEASAPK